MPKKLRFCLCAWTAASSCKKNNQSGLKGQTEKFRYEWIYIDPWGILATRLYYYKVIGEGHSVSINRKLARWWDIVIYRDCNITISYNQLYLDHTKLWIIIWKERHTDTRIFIRTDNWVDSLKNNSDFLQFIILIWWEIYEEMKFKEKCSLTLTLFLLIFWKNAWFNCEALIFIPFLYMYIIYVYAGERIHSQKNLLIYLFGTSFGYAIIFMLSFSNPFSSTAKRHLFLFIYMYIFNKPSQNESVDFCVVIVIHTRNFLTAWFKCVSHREG